MLFQLPTKKLSLRGEIFLFYLFVEHVVDGPAVVPGNGVLVEETDEAGLMKFHAELIRQDPLVRVDLRKRKKLAGELLNLTLYASSASNFLFFFLSRRMCWDFFRRVGRNAVETVVKCVMPTSEDNLSKRAVKLRRKNNVQKSAPTRIVPATPSF